MNLHLNFTFFLHYFTSCVLQSQLSHTAKVSAERVGATTIQKQAETLLRAGKRVNPFHLTYRVSI